LGLRLAERLLKSWKFKTVAIVLLAAGTTPLHAQNSQPVAIRAGRMFDSKSGKVLDNQIVLVEGEKISAVGPAERKSSI